MVQVPWLLIVSINAAGATTVVRLVESNFTPSNQLEFFKMSNYVDRYQ